MPSDTPETASRRRQRVLGRARCIVDGDGLRGLTIARLSAESGVSNGSLYHHFGSRGGIVRALCGEAFVASRAKPSGRC